jgi:sugar phosphate isomerase/epimerase
MAKLQSPANNRLAVCSWSLHPTDPNELISKLSGTGINRVQLALDPLRVDPARWGKAPQTLRDKQIEVVSGMFGCVGEDYSSLDSIRRTGGIAPDATWEQNWKNIQTTAALAHEMGLKLVTFHAGFLPHDARAPEFTKMIRRLGEVADTFGAANLALGLETGQETASDLIAVLKALNRPNVGVNFDPANMLLYDKGEPIESLQALGPWLRQVHIKDATRTKVPGTWGQEVPAGEGQVDWAAFTGVLRQFKFTGDLVIEREAGEKRTADIRKAAELIGNLL